MLVSTAISRSIAAQAKIDESAFALGEANRLEFPDMLGIIMNFGDVLETAKANQNPQIVIIHLTPTTLSPLYRT